MGKELIPRIFVKGLPKNCTKSQIKNFFSEYGKVLDILYKYGVDGNKKKGIAFVIFESQETVDKLLGEKFFTMENCKLVIKKSFIRRPDISKAKDEEKKDEKIMDFPKEALKCHVCKKEFSSIGAFFNHKQGKQHQSLLKLYRARSASVLELLRAESKLASDCLYDVNWVKENPNNDRPYCNMCQIHINCSLSRHEKSVEHKMVVSYVNKKCCNIEFAHRVKYENHLLTLKHLKNAYEKELKNKLKRGKERFIMKKAISIYKQCDQDLKELRAKYTDVDLNEELPSFANQPIGLNYIVKKINYYCNCCQQEFWGKTSFMRPHCRSYHHYLNLVDFNLEIEKENEKRRSEEQEKIHTKENGFEHNNKKREHKKPKHADESSSKKPKTDNKDFKCKGDDDGNEEENYNKDQHDEVFEVHEVEGGHVHVNNKKGKKDEHAAGPEEQKEKGQEREERSVEPSEEQEHGIKEGEIMHTNDGKDALSNEEISADSENQEKKNFEEARADEKKIRRR
ncbi:zinc finger protein on ecdysone puffs-like [Palaemon carinicauda]|uniref:zinc finger protein on ecdysone puffs-like n=1 Tax=Palaemon carinicauda TaxID=392227 RepID=UPI0035B63D50